MNIVSIIIPFHNSLEKLVEACISVKNQSTNEITKKEICIGNDSKYSNSELQDRLEKLNDNYCFIKVSKNKKTKGAGNARNAALSISSGSIIAFLDSDDIWYNSKLNEQLEFINKGYNFVTCAIRLKDTSIISYPPKKLNNINDLFLSFNAISTSTVVLKKEIIKDIRFNNLKFCQDLNFWSEILIKKECEYKSIQKPLVLYSRDGRTSKTNYLIRAYYYIKCLKKTKLKFHIKLISFFSYALRNLLKKTLNLLFLSLKNKLQKFF